MQFQPPNGHIRSKGDPWKIYIICKGGGQQNRLREGQDPSKNHKDFLTNKILTTTKLLGVETAMESENTGRYLKISRLA